VKEKISVVSPVYRAAEILPKLVSEIELYVTKLTDDYEIILVDDRSPDHSWEVMKQIAHENTKVKIIRLSKNFGQYPTTSAGLKHASGDWVVVIDCDLQDQPSEIINLFNKAQEGYDSVVAIRENRKDNFIRKAASSVFSYLFNYLTSTPRNSQASNFGIYKKKVIDAILSAGDTVKFFPLFVKWVGFNQVYLPVVHASRDIGTSSYNFKKLTELAISTIITFSNKPLMLFMRLGIIISLFSMVMGIITVYNYIIGNIEVVGYSSLFIAVCFFSGIIITTIGVLGIYLGKTFEQVKNRPEYILDEKHNFS
jgi:dolichol-phosphate mannosyltransferase